tara:strand:+ start:109 stop:336 length:228 start_codon:yes stop_codon:yes gene_type:complete
LPRKYCHDFFILLKLVTSTAIFFSKIHTSDKIEKLCLKAKASFNQTSQLIQVLADIEATLSKEENQKVTEKSQNK